MLKRGAAPCCCTRVLRREAACAVLVCRDAARCCRVGVLLRGALLRRDDAAAAVPCWGETAHADPTSETVAKAPFNRRFTNQLWKAIYY